jgi:ATP-binding protein involved in chromosome partitioning
MRENLVSKENVLDLLKTINYPGYSRDIVSFGIINNIYLEDKKIKVELDLRTSDKNVLDEIKRSIQNKLLATYPDYMIQVEDKPESAKKKTTAPKSNYLPNVKYKIAVASGKGGVGKSTVSVNLAVALAKLGYKVGLLDANIYGPSIPLMLGVKSKPEYDGKKLFPIVQHGVYLMSLGFLMDGDDAVIWRGPLVTRAIQQLMQDVNWGELDFMIFDMPPGTGDAQLTLSQSIQLDGAVIVSTPQDVSLIDAVKGVNMFKKVNVPILGIVENMSYFACPHCGKRTDIFSSGGVERECKRIGANFLGEIPLDVQIRAGGDSGKPVVVDQPENQQSIKILQIAENIAELIKNNSE